MRTQIGWGGAGVNTGEGGGGGGGAPRLLVCARGARPPPWTLRKLDQEAVDRIVWAMVVAGLEHAVELAELAMEETGFGVFEDKVVKNYIATEFLYDYLKDKRSVGVIDEDPSAAIQYVAEPIGVVLALLPITNPTSTALFKAIVAAKTRNAMIFRPVRARRALRDARGGASPGGRRGGRAAAARAPGDPGPDARRLPVSLPPPGRRLHLDDRRPEGGRRRERRRQAVPQRRRRATRRSTCTAAPTCGWPWSTC